jgi:hypothetical protein
MEFKLDDTLELAVDVFIFLVLVLVLYEHLFCLVQVHVWIEVASAISYSAGPPMTHGWYDWTGDSQARCDCT